MKAITMDQFRLEIQNLVGNEYELIDYYSKNKRMFAKIKHNKCNHIYEVSRINFIKGGRCPKCAKLNLSKTHDQFINEIKTLYDNKIDILDKYINNKTYILVKHNICNHKFKVRPDNLLSFGESCCKKCNGVLERENNIKYFKNCINNVLGKDKYLILTKSISEYKTPITLIHNKCNTKFITNLGDIIRGTKCPNCVNNKKRTLDDFKKEVYNLVKDEYQVIGDYVNTNTKIKIRHNKKECMHEWGVLPKNFIHNNYRCPKCNQSKGEQVIDKYLKDNNFIYKSQYRFKDCKYKISLPFDFAIFDNNNNIKYLIEYDGIQHSQFDNFFHGKTMEEKKLAYNLMCIKDEIKTNYCLKNKYSLIRINYTEYDKINEILKDKLKY